MKLVLENIEIRKIRKLLTLGDRSVIIMLTMGALGTNVESNLFKFDAKGNELWRATPPGNPDSFVEFWIIDDVLNATALSGKMCEVDMNSGKISRLRDAR